MGNANLETSSLKEQIATSLPVLDAMGSQLRQTASQIETAVVSVCNRFQSVVKRTRAGVARVPPNRWLAIP